MQDNGLAHLSRRKLLAATGAVGAASLGAGLGTSAYFSDEESFTNNSFTAGELDLKVDYQNLYWGPQQGPYGAAGRPYVSAYPDADDDGVRDGTDSPGDDDDVAQPLVELSDLKPGDSGCLEVGLELIDNPGFLCVSGSLEESENDRTEPEAEVDSTPDQGELGEHVEATLFYDVGCDAVGDAGCEPDEDDVVLAQGSLREVFKLLDDGRLVTDGEEACLAGGERHCLVMHWELPAETGNVVQSDGATVDLSFYTEQCRHNALESFEEHPCASCFQTDLVTGPVHEDLSDDGDGTYGDEKISHRWGATADYDEHSSGTNGEAGVSVVDDISWSDGEAEVTIDVDASALDDDEITFASYYAQCPPEWKGDASKKYQLLIDHVTVDATDGQQTLTVDIPERQV